MTISCLSEILTHDPDKGTTQRLPLTGSPLCSPLPLYYTLSFNTKKSITSNNNLKQSHLVSNIYSLYLLGALEHTGKASMLFRNIKRIRSSSRKYSSNKHPQRTMLSTRQNDYRRFLWVGRNLTLSSIAIIENSFCFS